jgi:hypothetical protein
MNDMDMMAVFRDGFAIDREEEPTPTPRARRAARASVTNEPAKPGVRITCQFRDAQAMVYDLNVGERKIELRVQPSPAAGWNIALTIKGDARTLDATAASRQLALTALSELSGDAFGREEWDRIRDALTDVRAL